MEYDNKTGINKVDNKTLGRVRRAIDTNHIDQRFGLESGIKS